MRNSFRKRIRESLANPVLQKALDNNAERRTEAFHNALATLPEHEALRDHARLIRQETISHLDEYKSRFIERLLANGFQVHIAKDAVEARLIVVDIAKGVSADFIVKSKTMVSEEIELNHALESAGIRPIESDLGEFIVQLRGEPPAHIITPAIHLLRDDVAKTFQQKLDMKYSTDVADLNLAARRHLRDRFLRAPVGLSGVNFGVAETGTICLVTNEGNGRMVTTLPPVHIALMGLERIVPTLDDLAVMLQLLPRFATGQKITSYVSLIQRPRQPEDEAGPGERHLVLVDNGRSSMRESNLAEALLCIRCGACLNACPVYREAGGHAYASVYPGPIGSLVSPGLFGVEAYGHLSKASTLCGACAEACPVRIDFPALLLRARDRYTQSVAQPWWMSFGLHLFTWLATRPGLYRSAQRLAGLGSSLLTRSGNWLTAFPPPLNAWTRSRHFPPFARKPFLANVKESHARSRLEASESTDTKPASAPDRQTPAPLSERMRDSLLEVDGEWISCHVSELPERLVALLQDFGAEEVLIWGESDPLLISSRNHLKRQGIRLVEPHVPHRISTARLRSLDSIAAVTVGITGAQAGLADTGSLVLTGGGQRSGLVSLLPEIHIALLNKQKIQPSLRAWIQGDGKEILTQSPYTVLVTGPSRTADIEMTLTLGVHGPGRLIVLCYQET